jgi:hypothetical protein
VVVAAVSEVVALLVQGRAERKSMPRTRYLAVRSFGPISAVAAAAALMGLELVTPL